jgi:hypothetical protein
MSLRSQVHHAIDDVAPPAPMLERRVKAFVLSDDADRKHLIARPQPRWVAPLGLIAAALVLALVAGLFIGGRYWRTQNAAPATVNQGELKSLESKPLNYPALAAGAACPTTPLTLNQQFGLVYGKGPIFLYDWNSTVDASGRWGYWQGLNFFSAETIKGLVLVRARDLKGDAQVAFAQYPLAPTKMHAAGPVLGTTTVVGHQVQLRSEAVIQDPALYRPQGLTGGKPELIVLFGMQVGSSGCIGFQIDGPGFTENFVIRPGVPGV